MVDVLHLTLKRHWFDAIRWGEKKEEYREFKPYWIKRLLEPDGVTVKKFDEVHFTNGYGKDRPFMRVEWEDCYVVTGRIWWEDFHQNTMEVFVIELGKVLGVRNCRGVLPASSM